MKNYYSILGVAKNASRTDIRKAYLQKAKLYHPDLNSSPSAPSKFKEIQEAYNTLYDANRRKEYDSATIFGPSSRTGQAYRYNVNREYRNYTETPYENDSFESQFKAEAQRLRREWEQMEEKFRKENEKLSNFENIFKIRFFNNLGSFNPSRTYRFSESYSHPSTFIKYLFYLFNRILPLIMFPLGLVFYFTRPDPPGTRRAGSKIQIVYDSYGRAYTFDAYGRRYRIPEFDRR
ncbi:DnaJ domain protein [Theileria parva strain Muguga]|uniref:DnaJ domain protein n=1 Tax=Theileria parva strain Muguga TaxID=333668 RepID=UPI001C6245CE|nr:DnaJ domain protein [Theileria parva strain Muguga]KAF5153434.1 DnaJ domain protein [Theileria parva strain Muguga]